MNKILRNKLFFASAILSSMLIIRDLMGVDIHQIIILLFIFLVAVMMSYDDLFCFTSFVAPIACGVNGFAITILYIFLVAKAKHKSHIQFVPALILIIIELLHFSVYSFPISSELLYFSNILLFFYCSNDRNNVNPNKVVEYFIYGAALCCFVIAGRTYMTTGSFMSIFLDNARTGVTMGGDAQVVVGQTHMALNANSLAFISILGISCLLVGRKFFGLNKIIYSSLFFLLLFGGAITVGRTWMLVLLLVLLTYILVSNFKRKIQFLFLSLLIFLFIAQLDELNAVLSIISSDFLDRFSSSDLSEAGGRKDLWYVYMDIWASSLDYIILGISSPNYRLLFPQINAIHNFTQQVFVCTGLLGFLVYLMFFFKIIVCGFREHVGLIHFLPLISALMYLQSISVLSDWLLVLPIFPCIYVLRIKSIN